MLMERPQRRMTLRQLLTHSEKSARDLIDRVKTELFSLAKDFRELSRPVRRRYHFPTLLALHNARQKLSQANDETQQLTEYLMELLREIRDYAKREREHRR